jgi:hypothetical protein
VCHFRIDVFTLAGDRGAIATVSVPLSFPDQSLSRHLQLLYSKQSESCLLNDEYINRSDKRIDVFVTTGSMRAQYVAFRKERHDSFLLISLL